MRSKGVWGLHRGGDKNAVGSSGEVRFEVVKRGVGRSYLSGGIVPWVPFRSRSRQPLVQ